MNFYYDVGYQLEILYTYFFVVFIRIFKTCIYLMTF